MGYSRQHPITTYFLLTAFISWVIGIPWAIIMGEVQLNDFVTSFFMRFGPSFAGLLTVFIVAGKAGIGDLIARTISLRGAPLGMIAFILIIPPVFFYFSLLIVGYGDSLHGLAIGTVLGSFAIQFILHSFIGGGLSEEIGWRGFLLPKLAEKYSPLAASAIVSIPWVLWHWPVFLLGDGTVSDMAPFALTGLALSTLFTWAYFRSGGSILIVILFHGSFNAGTYTLAELLPKIQAEVEVGSSFDWTIAWFWVVTAGVICWFYKSQLGRVKNSETT